MSQDNFFQKETERVVVQQKPSTTSEQVAGETQLGNISDTMETFTFPKVYTNFEKPMDSSLSTKKNDMPSPDGSKPVNSASIREETATPISKFRSAEDLRKETENINTRIRFLQSQLAAKEAALEARKNFLSCREQLAEKAVSISCTTRKSCQTERTELLHVIVSRIQVENAHRISESHRILQDGLYNVSCASIYTKLREERLEIQDSEEDDLQKHLESYIQSEKESQLEKIRTLREEYFTLRDAWIERIRKMERYRSEEGSSGSRERDVWLVRAIRGIDVVKATRSRLPNSSATNGSSSEEGDTRLENESVKQVNGYSSEYFQNRTTAVIPGQVSLFQPFEGGNVRYENPVVETYFDTLVNPWTRAERIIFLKKFLQHGKNFRKIATFLEYKTTEDVVRYYFKNKLKLNLKLLAKEYMGSRQQSWKASSAILATSGFPADSVTRRWIIDNFNGRKDTEHMNTSSVEKSVPSDQKRRTREAYTLADIFERDFDSQLNRVLHEYGLQYICSNAPKVGNSTVCIPVGRDGYVSPYYLMEKVKVKQQLKHLIEQRRNGVWKVEGRKKKIDVKKYRWTSKERNTFFKLLKEVGCNWEKIAEQIATKSPLQLRAFYDEYMAQKGAEVSEENSTTLNSSSVAGDNESGAFARILRKRKHSQENASTNRFLTTDVNALAKERVSSGDSSYEVESVPLDQQRDELVNEDNVNAAKDGANEVSNNDLGSEETNSKSVKRRMLNVHDLLSE